MDNTQIRHLTRHLLSNIILQEALHIHTANPRILNCKPCRFVTDQNIFIFILFISDKLAHILFK